MVFFWRQIILRIVKKVTVMAEAGGYEIDDTLAQTYEDSAGQHPQLSRMAVK